ncbi:MAG: CinA family protein [Candidatus Dormibacteria bacterium]
MTAPMLPDLALVFPQAERVLELAQQRPLRTVATAESCTGGLLAAALTAVPGSSNFFLGGVVAYANFTKSEALGVPEPVLAAHGAVSGEVAAAMAWGVRDRLGSTVGLATTGVAGPSASESKPAGLIYVALAGPAGLELRRLDQDRGRNGNRVAAVMAALELLLVALG